MVALEWVSIFSTSTSICSRKIVRGMSGRGGDNVVADAVDEMWVWACLCLQKACRLLLISYAHHQLSAYYTVIAISTSQPWNGNNNEWVYVCEIKMPLQLLLIAIICSQAVSFLPTYAVVSVWILHHGFIITSNNMQTLIVIVPQQLTAEC